MAKKSALDKLRIANKNTGAEPVKETKRKKESKPDTKYEVSEPVVFDYAKDEEELNRIDVKQKEKKGKSDRRRALLSKVATFLLLVGSVYMVFLIYGALNTTYVYDNSGKVVPQVMTVEKLEELEDFNKYITQYRKCRTLYEKVLVLDYRVAAGQEDPLQIAPLYDELLVELEAYSIDLQAVTLPAKYKQAHQMLLAWLGTDVAVYLQRMPQALTYNNQEYAKVALEFKSLIYNDFSIITSNLISLSELVDGAEIEDVRTWSPEKYIRENIG